MRNVLFVAPFPLETTMRFARAASAIKNVRFLGILQEMPRGNEARFFDDIVLVKDGLDSRQLIEAAHLLRRKHGEVHRAIGILESLQVQIAEVRRALGIPGPSPETADLFRDKSQMKNELRRHGLPCARHRLLRNWGDAESFASEVGFPMVVKPPAGMGCKATWRIGSIGELREAMDTVHPTHDRPLMAEEFLRGQEYSFETITIGGKMQFYSLTRYYPAPLEVVESPWIKWVCLLPRVIDGPDFADVRALGERVVTTLGLETGMTHMEWFRKADGSLAIGEIAARPPGANMVRMNGFAYDTDMYRAWARAVIDDAFDGPWERKYSVACAFLRGPGEGRVKGVSGVARANELVGRYVVESRLPQEGAPKAESYEGDGHVIVRHPDTEVVKRAMTTIIETIQVHYG